MNWEILKEPTIIATSVVYGILGWIALKAGMFGLWLGLLLFVSYWRYSYSVLRAVAQGRKRIPPPDIESMNPIGHWYLFFHFLFFPGLVIATAPYQPIGLVVAILVAFVFPASAAVIGLTQSLNQGFSPSALIEFRRTLGTDYWMLVFGCAAISLGGNFIISTVAPVFGPFALILSFVVELWALLGMFALIGSALRAHRLEFEIAGELKPPEERKREQQHEEWKKSLDIAYASFRSGLLASGYKPVRDLVAQNGDTFEVNYWLVENMLEWQDKRFAIELASRLMPRLLESGDAAAALDLYRRLRRYDVAFNLTAEQSEQLGAHAAAYGQTGLAAELGYNRKPTSSH